jgi:hypothetical protein
VSPVDDIPSSWIATELSAIIDYGRTDKAEPADIPPDAWVLELEDIEKDTSRILQRVTFRGRQSKSTKNRFRKGDVLYGKLRPYLNKVIVADHDGYCTTEILPLRPNEGIQGSYLFYWLKHPTFLDYVSANSHGLNMPRLGTEAGKHSPLVLAPFAEQERIADKLDRLLARVDACRERLDRVPLILKRFRQSVLAAATSGQLTEDWRDTNPQRETAEGQVLRNEHKRLASVRARAINNAVSKIDLAPLPPMWSWVQNHRLAQDSSNAICAGPFGTIFKAKDFRTEGVPIIFLRHVGEGRYLTDKPGYMDRGVWEELHQQYSIHGGELLVAKLGDPPRHCLHLPHKHRHSDGDP